MIYVSVCVLHCVLHSMGCILFCFLLFLVSLSPAYNLFLEGVGCTFSMVYGLCAEMLVPDRKKDRVGLYGFLHGLRRWWRRGVVRKQKTEKLEVKGEIQVTGMGGRFD